MAMSLVKEKMRPNHLKENLCKWVRFPDGKTYLLPVVAKQQRIHPVILNGAVVSVEVVPGDPELSNLVEDYYKIVSLLQGNELELTGTSLVKLFKLAQRLLLTNYDLSDEEITKILTYSNDKLSEFIKTLNDHIKSS